MSHYTKLYKYGKRTRDFLGRFDFDFDFSLLYFGGVFNKPLFHSRLLDLR